MTWRAIVATAASLGALAMCLGRSASASATDLRLVEAVQRKDQAAARALVQQKGKVDVNARQPDGATALAWAAHWNDLETATLLIEAGANVNAANELGVTPLMLAAVNGSAPMVGRLLRAGADPSLARPSGETALLIAARAGSLEAVRLLVEGGAAVNARTARGATALMWAAIERHADVARFLLDRGADMHARTASTTPPNRNYAGRDDAQIARGPRPVLRDREALNPEYRRDLLRSRDGPRPEGGFTPLLYAALSGDRDTVRILRSAGAAVNDAAADGMTPLVLSLVKRHEALALDLLDLGADPNAAGTGYTALHVASATGQAEAVRALLARGADPNSRLEKPVSFTEAFVTGTKVSPGAGWVDLKGATPFMIAARSVDVRIMRLLREGGADPLRTADDGTTGVMLAAGLGKRANADIGYYTWDETRAIEAAAYGLELGIGVNARNQDGETALHAAAYHAANRLVKFLVEKRADVNARNWQDQTPLLIAHGHLVCCTTFVRHPETADVLLASGADENVGTRLNFGLGSYDEEKFKPR
jgi:ankyrin repeat protein